MGTFPLRCAPLLAGAVALAMYHAASAQPGYAPVFQDGPGGWQHPFGGEFPEVPGSALPMRQDPAYPFINPVVSYRFADLTNPNLMQWAKDLMKKDNDEIHAGKIAFTANSSCLPQGVPVFMLSGGPFHFLQTPEKVVIIEEGSQQVRRIYLNVPHSPSPKPSWFGESVGWYEGDTLVVDTIGFNTETVVDSYRTPHTEKLHVVERWRLTGGGHTLRVDIEVEDPGTFYQPWRTYQEYRRVREPLTEEICAENNRILFDYGTPEAEIPDF